MSILKINTGDYPLTDREVKDAIKVASPKASVPRRMSDAFLENNGYTRVQSSDRPAHDSLTQGVREIEPVQQGGQWVQQWEVYSLPADEVTANKTALVEARRAEVIEEFNSTMQQIASQYPALERESWHKQLDEAHAYTADPNADTPFIDASMAETGETKADLVQNILAKDAAFAQLSGEAVGRKRARTAALDAIDPNAADFADQVAAV